MTETSYDVQIARLADSPFLDSLQSTHRYALGFLPRAAHLDYLHRGHVLISRQNDQAAGFLLWRPSWHPAGRQAGLGLQIVQLVVQHDARRILHATELLSVLQQQTQLAIPSFMRCWCASDLEANLFWSALRFDHDLTRDLTSGTRHTRTHHHWTRSALKPARLD